MLCFHIDLDPSDDIRFLTTKKIQELQSGRDLTPFCSFGCRLPTSAVLTWRPRPEASDRVKAPLGKIRIFFFPICGACAEKEHDERELEWGVIEGLNVNVPVWDDGYAYHH